VLSELAKKTRFIDRQSGQAAVLKQISESIEINELHTGHCQSVQACRVVRSEGRISSTLITVCLGEACIFSQFNA
jgi:hypothetical protein